MTLQQAVVLALQASVLLTVFGFGLRATVSELLYLLRRPWLLARSLVAMFVVMPIIAVILVRSFELRPSFEIALIALSISPVPPLLPTKESKAGGVTAYALGLMGVVALLAIVVVPMLVEVGERYFDRPFQMPPAAIAKVVLTTIVVPLVAGLLVRALVPTVASRLAKPIRLVAPALLLAGAVALLASALPAMLGLADGRTLVAMTAFVSIGLAAGHWLGGPHAEEATVLALSTANRHPAIAFALAKTNSPDEPFLGVSILLYLVVAAVLSVPYVSRQRRNRGARPS